MRARHHINWLTAHAQKTADISGTHSQAAKLLGGARVRVAAALRSGSGRGHDGAGDFPASAGAEAVPSRLCAAISPSGGWALWGESKSAVQAHSVAGDPQAAAGKRAGFVLGIAQGGGH